MLPKAVPKQLIKRVVTHNGSGRHPRLSEDNTNRLWQFCYVIYPMLVKTYGSLSQNDFWYRFNAYADEHGETFDEDQRILVSNWQKYRENYSLRSKEQGNRRDAFNAAIAERNDARQTFEKTILAPFRLKHSFSATEDERSFGGLEQGPWTYTPTELAIQLQALGIHQPWEEGVHRMTYAVRGEKIVTGNRSQGYNPRLEFDNKVAVETAKRAAKLRASEEREAVKSRLEEEKTASEIAAIQEAEDERKAKVRDYALAELQAEMENEGW
jgi:hypothetical protein